MPDSPRVLAVVPARGGSRGLPGKNLRPLAGMPLIGHSLAAARLLPSVTRCVVSTDSEEIAASARELGGDVPFLRDAALAADDTPMAPVLRHALESVEAQEAATYDAVLLLDPTSPVRRLDDIEEAVARLMAHRSWDGVVSVSSPDFHPVWVGVREDETEPGRMARYFADGTGITRRQQLDRFLRVNGTFYVWRASFVRRMESSWLDEGVHGFLETPEAEAFAIDYLHQFKTLEALLAQGTLRLPWLDAASPA